MTSPLVCVDENLTVNAAGQLQMAPWSVPRLVADTKAVSGGDGPIAYVVTPPGRLMIETATAWRNNTPLPQTVLIRVTRSTKHWITSNPNAVQFRDRWTHAINAAPPVPNTSGVFNSEVGSAIDLGTNTSAVPVPGVLWEWWGAGSIDEWVQPLQPGDVLAVWYRCYAWTPAPWSANANKNNPVHRVLAGWVRIQLIAFPHKDPMVNG